MIDWFCTQCTAKAFCKYRSERGTCVYEYDANKGDAKYLWKGEGAPPRRWTALDGTVVYRSYSDYCD